MKSRSSKHNRTRPKTYPCNVFIEAGANIKYVSTRLGHKNINITLDVYSDVLKEEEKAADMMDKLIENL